jgi:hypothetical protein
MAYLCLAIRLARLPVPSALLVQTAFLWLLTRMILWSSILRCGRLAQGKLYTLPQVSTFFQVAKLHPDRIFKPAGAVNHNLREGRLALLRNY